MNGTVKALAVALLGLPFLAAGCTVLVAGADNDPPPPAARAPGRVPGIPPAVLDAYVRAASAAGRLAPRCRGVRWQILAGIGRVESDHATWPGRRIAANGDVYPSILGPRLDGSNRTMRISDTDNGKWDHDTVFDRAVGLLQFIPSTWDGHEAHFGRDGNGDGYKNPNNVYDSAYAAVVHLCENRRIDLSTKDDLDAALYRYNRMWSYVRKVEGWIAYYDRFGAKHRRPGVPGSGKGRTMLAAAMRWSGWPYSWAGGNASGPSYGVCCSPAGRSGASIKGFDCSGLTIYTLAQVGVRGVVHSATWQYNNAAALGGIQIPASEGIEALRPGDLVFFGDRFFKHHVGIYYKNGTMFNAPRPGRDLGIDPLLGDYAGAVRLLD